MWSPQDARRLRIELDRPLVEEVPLPAFDQVDLLERWRQDGVGMARVKRERSWVSEAPEEIPPLPKRQLATTVWQEEPPLVPTRSHLRVLDPPPPTPRHPVLNWSDIPEDAVPISRQNAFGPGARPPTTVQECPVVQRSVPQCFHPEPPSSPEPSYTMWGGPY